MITIWIHSGYAPDGNRPVVRNINNRWEMLPVFLVQNARLAMLNQIE
ncbi:Uncharacterised protein [Mycobacterium tuberculosis]|nr:Uncharacterised protein [Mycobacterium tuberculosis]